MNAQHKEHIKHINKLKGNVLEIGVCKGGTTQIFCEAVKKYGGAVIAIDPLDNDEYYPAFKQNILDKYDIEFHRKPSSEAFAAIANPFSYAFIDGSHTYEDCLCDLLNVHKMINDNGIVCLDDTNIEDVQRALREVVAKRLYKVIPHNNTVEHKEYVMLKIVR